MKTFKSYFKNAPQVFAVFIATVTSISDGMHYSWSSPNLPKLMNDDVIKITKTDSKWIDCSYLIGGITAIPIILYLTSKYGRNLAIAIASIIMLKSWFFIYVRSSVWHIYASRFLAGISACMNFVFIPIYTGEIAHQNIRGMLNAFINIMVLFGVLIMYTLAPLVDINTTAFVEDINEEFAAIKEAVTRQESERGNPQDIFLEPSNRKALITLVVLNAFQHFSAKSVIIMNAHTILEDITELISIYRAGILLAGSMLISAICGMLLMDYFGRRILLTFSSICTAVCLWIIAIYFHLSSRNMISGYSWIPALVVIVYAGIFRIGLGLVPLVFTGELFPTKLKALGITLSVMSYILFGLLSLSIFHLLKDAYGLHVPFYMFGICSVGAAIFAKNIPETKGKTLEEIQMLLKSQKVEP